MSFSPAYYGEEMCPSLPKSSSVALTYDPASVRLQNTLKYSIFFISLLAFDVLWYFSKVNTIEVYFKKHLPRRQWGSRTKGIGEMPTPVVSSIWGILGNTMISYGALLCTFCYSHNVVSHTQRFLTLKQLYVFLASYITYGNVLKEVLYLATRESMGNVSTRFLLASHWTENQQG